MKEDGFVTLAIAALFFIGMLYAGWLNGVRQWIAGKVNEQ